jgi:hypothetical protein
MDMVALLPSVMVVRGAEHFLFLALQEEMTAAGEVRSANHGTGRRRRVFREISELASARTKCSTEDGSEAAGFAWRTPPLE